MRERAIDTFLHDGRASSIEEAITAHDVQRLGARERFDRLDASDKARLVAFLRSL